MNWLFFIFAAVGLAGVVHMRKVLRREGVRTMPGYSLTDGAALKLDPLSVLRRGEDWDAVRLEEFHSAHRARVVVQLWARAAIGDAMRELAAATATEIAERTQAHVVYVEVLADHQLRVAHMLAPDGRGWTGNDRAREVWHMPQR